MPKLHLKNSYVENIYRILPKIYGIPYVPLDFIIVIIKYFLLIP